MHKILLLAILFVCNLPCQNAVAQTAVRYLARSDFFYNNGRYDSALRYAWLAEPLVADSTTRNSKEYGYFVGQYFSMNHEAAGNNDSASYWYRFSLNMFEAHQDTASNEYGETLINYGNSLNNITYYTEALPYLQKGTAVMEYHQENINAYLGGLNNLANNYNYCGEYFHATELYSKCLDGLNQHPELATPVLMGTLHQNLATVSSKTGNLKDAELNFEKACTLFKKSGSLPAYYEAKKNLGGLYLSVRNIKKAEETFTGLNNDSLLNRHTGGNPNDILSERYVQVLNGLGVVRELQQQYKEAENLYQQSLRIAQKLAAKRGLISSQSCLAHLYTITNRRQAADSLYEKLFTQPLTRGSYDHFTYFSAYTYYCENLIMLHQLSKAFEKIKYISKIWLANLQNNFPGMAEEDQMNYLVSLNNYKNLLSFLIDQQQVATNEAVNFSLNRLLLLKGMILTYQQRRLQSLRSSEDKTLTNLVQKWVSIKQKLYSSHNSRATPAVIDSLEGLAKMYDQNIAVKMGVPPETISDSLPYKISTRLLPGEAAIEFVRYQPGEGKENRYGAFILRRNARPSFVKLCTESRLKQCFKTSLSNNFNTVHPLTNGRVIYNLVWKPVSQQLQGTGTVYYSPAGLLNYISLDVLPGRQPNASLLHDINFVQLSNIRNLLNATYSQNEPATAAVLWGNIDCSEAAYNIPTVAYPAQKPGSLPGSLVSEIKGGPAQAGFKPLKNDELPAVRKIVQQKSIPLRVYDSVKATEESFKQDAADFSGWLHISSHGFYASNPTDSGVQQQYANSFTTQENPLLRCGLILNGANRAWSGKPLLPNREDGILTGYEIAMMDLSKVKLVVLSACETGLGDIDAGSEGVLGLQRAFRLAGVNKIVISLWNVNAKATEQLMTAFYQQLTEGNNPATALRNAKLQMVKKKNPPYAWAGFVLVQ